MQTNDFDSFILINNISCICQAIDSLIYCLEQQNILPVMGKCVSKQQYRSQKNIRSSFIIPEEVLSCTDFQSQRRRSLVLQGVSIRKNSKTGKLEGIPEEWYRKYNFPFEIDESKVAITRDLPQQIRPESELPDNILNFISKQKQLREKFIRKREKEQQQQKRQAAELFVRDNNNKSINLLDVSNMQMISELEDTKTALDIITNYGNQIYQSKFQRQLLTTHQFKLRLEQIYFIQDQPAKHFKFARKLGIGSMCKVYKVSEIDHPNKLYAVRIISIQARHYLDKIKEEIAVMCICKSSNIIQYYFSYFYQETLFMFIEYMQYGSLNTFINHYRQKTEEAVISYIIREILKGLEAIHRRRQLHRDLKSDNILINKFGQIKIGDFGYALQFTREKTTCSDHAGTPAWMAPELIKKEQYTESVDIWSLGIILVELCEGQPRYLSMKPLIAMVMIVSRPPENVTGRSNQLRTFLNRCLKKDPLERATAKQLLSDPFILNIGDGAKQKQQFIRMLSCINPSQF